MTPRASPLSILLGEGALYIDPNKPEELGAVFVTITEQPQAAASTAGSPNPSIKEGAPEQLQDSVK